MKKLLLSIAMVGLFATTVNAQDAKKEAPVKSADQKAVNETQKASKQLSLSVDQESKFKALTLQRVNTIAPLKQKAQASTDKAVKKSAHSEIKAAREKYFNDVNAILNADQQVKWAEHKKQMQEKNASTEHAD